jgi:hypothetical protein
MEYRRTNLCCIPGLKIKIMNNKIQTETYKKEMNLYLCIPPLSTYPPSSFKGLIIAKILCYWCQNNE